MNEDTAMTSLEDRELLRRFAEQASASAFDELVRRHLDHVYSAALRRVNGERALAEDVAQTVFIDLARKAKRIPADMPPGGWLHRHTGFVASKMIDKERRRRNREQEAATMNAIDNLSDDADWASTAPLLDAAMDSLPSADRDAIVLRFFEQRDFRSVGEALGTSDDTAQKRVSRAVDKLRALLGNRGVTSTGGALAALMVANSVQAAPASLAGQVSAGSLAGAATAGGTVGGALANLETAARLKLAAAAVALMGAAGFAGSKLAEPENSNASGLASGVGQTETTSPADAGPALPEQAADEPEPAGPMSVDELVAAAAAEWKGGRERMVATVTALGYLSKIEPGQLEAALKATARLADRPAAALVSKHLLSHLAETNPTQAYGYALNDESVKGQPDVVDGVLRMWAGKDPRALLNYTAKRGAGSVYHSHLTEPVLGTIFRTTAGKDPAMALSDLRRLFNPTQRSQALRGILDTVQTDEQLTKVTKLIEEMGDSEIRVQARRAMVEHWAMRDAAGAAEYVAQAEPAWERTRMMDSLGMTWLLNDPATAAEWWVEHAPGPDTLVKVINIWAQSDPEAASRWLDKQKRGPTSDAARMTFARQVADLDPKNALLWADTVSDAEMREGTIDHVFANWHIRDAGAASKFLRECGWDAEQIRRLQDSTK